MRTRFLGISLLSLLVPLQVQAQSFAYERSIQISTIPIETSVWIPLDLHALQDSVGGYQIVDSNGTAVPYKMLNGKGNILQEATLLSFPVAADTEPAQRIQDLVDGNPATNFQPVAGSQHRFLFSFDEPRAPSHLSYQLSSGWIEHVRVRIGMDQQSLRDSYVGTPSGTTIALSGEKAKVFEITFTTRSGVVSIAEAALVSPWTKVLFRASPGKTYTLRYGTKSRIAPSNADTVYEDSNTIFGSLGPVRYIGDIANDSDRDHIPDALDNCPYRANTDQADRDGDSLGDECDNAPLLPNSTQKDTDKDGIGDPEDNCPNHRNPDQKDIDLDGIGWVCDDADGDGVRNEIDNCVGLKNRDQMDLDANGIGDLCETDPDRDGVPSATDNCSTDSNPDQADSDGDGIGDLCDACPLHYDPKQLDRDENGIGDVCQNIAEQALKADRDTDEDGIADKYDVCKNVYDPEQSDTDKDGIGDRCDNCPRHQNRDQRDRNKDGVGDMCTDTDGDGYVDPLDNCAPYANADQRDKDEDGIGDPCDDEDGDRIENARDNCPYDRNPLQEDEDKDGEGNVCDTADNRWSEERPWILWASMGTMILVLTGLGALILKKTN